MPETKRHLEKPWFSKLTSEEILLQLRIQLNISRKTGRVQNQIAKQLNGSLTTFETKELCRLRTEIGMAQPN